MLAWQQVETAVFTVFFSMFDKPQLMQVGALFYSQDSFGGKLRLVEALAKVTLKPEQEKDWKKLVTRLVKASAERNVLAHFTAVADFEGDSDIKLVLAPPMFVPPELQKARARKYDAEGCGELVDEFTQLAQALQKFATDKGW